MAISEATPNQSPVLAASIWDQSFDEDTTWSFTVPVNTFTDDEPLAYMATLADGSPLPSWLTFDAATRTFSGTPPANLNGGFELKVIANDGQLSAEDTFYVTINPVPDRPVAVEDRVSVLEDGSVSGNVLINDIDVDGVGLQVPGIAVYAGLLWPVIVPLGEAGFVWSGRFGTLTIKKDGSYTYVADKEAADAITEGETATEYIVYHAANKNDTAFMSGTTLIFDVVGVDNDIDIFRIRKPDPKTSISTFDSETDQIFLNDRFFKGLGGDGTPEGTPLKRGSFVSNSGHATKDRPQIIYDEDNGRLLYDSDGKGGDKAVHFATITNKVALSISDFELF